MTLSFVRIPYTFTMCIWKRTKDCIMPPLKPEDETHKQPSTRRKRAIELISYDIKNDKIRTKFAKMLRAQGAIRLQFSVYEVNNTQRIIDNIKINIVDKFSKLFTGADSVLIFDAPNAKVQKFGNAIHRDAEIVYL